MLKMGQKPKPWGVRVAKASRARKLGEISLKTTLSMLSMVGSMALFSSIEQALAPDDLVGRQWIASEKAAYLKEMAAGSWFQKPWTIYGCVICLLIMTCGGSLGWRATRHKKEEQDDGKERDQDKEMVAVRIVERDIVAKDYSLGRWTLS